MAEGSNWTKVAAVIGAVAALITAVTAAVTNVFGLLDRTQAQQSASTSAETNVSHPQPPTPPTQALHSAEQQAAAWLAALSSRDVDELVRLSDPPFFLDEAGRVLLDKVQIREAYEQQFASQGGAKGPIRIEKIGAELISDLKQRGWNPRSDRLMNSLRLSDDDIAVVATSRGESIIFFFRRSGDDVKLAGLWD
jgi:hypothetical protein